jgi:hypothetical protein
MTSNKDILARGLNKRLIRLSMNHRPKIFRAIATPRKIVENPPQVIPFALRWEKRSLKFLKIASAALTRCLCQTTRVSRLLGPLDLELGSAEEVTIEYYVVMI